VTDDPRHIRHLTAGDLAERESLPVSTVYGWNYSGEGPPYFRVGRHVRYRLEDVERWELERIVERSDRYKAIERTGRRRYESQVRQYEQRLREYEWQVRELEQRAYAARPRPPAAPEQLVPPQPLAPPIEEQRALLDRILKGG
jgi:hypothetical protein